VSFCQPDHVDDAEHTARDLLTESSVRYVLCVQPVKEQCPAPRRRATPKFIQRDPSHRTERIRSIATTLINRITGIAAHFSRRTSLFDAHFPQFVLRRALNA
jgi:hypothetical protein